MNPTKGYRNPESRGARRKGNKCSTGRAAGGEKCLVRIKRGRRQELGINLYEKLQASLQRGLCIHCMCIHIHTYISI